MQLRGRLYGRLTCGLVAILIALTSADEEPGCHLRAGTIQPTSSQRRALRTPQSQGISAISQQWWDVTVDAQQYILIVQQKITRDLQITYEGVLNGSGVLSQYLPTNSFLVVASPQAAQRLLSVKETAGVEVFMPEYKVDDQLSHHPAWRAAEGEGCTGPKCAPAGSGTGREIHYEDDQGRLVVRALLPRNVIPKLEVVAVETHQAVQAACGNLSSTACELVSTQDGHLDIAVEPARLRSVSLALAGLPFIHWLELRAVLRLRNIYSTAVLQSGQSTNLTTWQPNNAVFPFWQSNITGEGQLIGMSDSGLNFKSCFFDDPNVDQPGPTHRKIISYRVVEGGDMSDLGEGHGTHVGGTLVGELLVDGDAGRENGVAYRAKLAFTDLLKDGTYSLKPPEGGIKNLYAHDYELGVRLHSDSWGATSRFNYDADCAFLDEFTWTHPDFAAVVAAGNDGMLPGAAETIGSPASSKNCIAIGSAKSDIPMESLGEGPQGFGNPWQLEDPTTDGGMPVTTTAYDIYIMSSSTLEKAHLAAGLGQAGMASWDSVISTWLPVVEEEGLQIWQGTPDPDDNDARVFDVVFGEPLDGCVDSGGLAVNTSYFDLRASTESSLKNSIVLLQHDGQGCSLDERVKAAAQAGAAGVLIYPNIAKAIGFPDLVLISSNSSNKLEIPTGGVAQGTAYLVERILRSGERAQLVVGDPTDPTSAPAFDNVDDFSAFGPTLDGRIKPDVIAVGSNILSASAFGECGVASMSGTSMAAPFIGGATVLVRDYFISGFYPSASRNVSDSMTPSGMLIKAVIINSCVNMKGVAENGLPLERVPSFRQGWGRTQLDTGLPLPHSDSPFSLWVQDMAMINTHETHRYCVSMPNVEPAYSSDVATANGANSSVLHPLAVPVQVTLVWYDPPPSPSAKFTIVNDLDLDIIVPPGTLNASRGAAIIPDRINTVERATLQFPVNGANYLLTVHGFNVPVPDSGNNREGLPYSLAMTAPQGTRVCDCKTCDCSQCPSIG